MNSFDHYHKWLAIPPENQPPNHYQLLALQLYESDPDVIEAAADQRMAHIRSYQAGKNGELAQELLNELSAARIVLLNEDKRTEYDAQLSRTISTDLPASPQTASPSTTFDLAELPNLDGPTNVLDADASNGRSAFGKQHSPAPPRFWMQPILIVVGLAALLLGMASVAITALWRGFPGRTEPALETSAPTRLPTAAQDPKELLRDALEKLKTAPDDPDANLIAGKHFCFERGEWKRGLAMLSKCSDPSLRELAKQDLSQKPTKVTLARRWRDAGEQTQANRREMLERSAYWYVESLPQAIGAAKKEALENVLEIAERNSTTALGEPTDLLAMIDVDRHGEKGMWERDGDQISSPKGGSPSLLVPVKVRGAYRLELSLTQLANDTIRLALPLGLSRCEINLHGYHGDLSEVLVDGNAVVRTRPGRLAINQRHKVAVDVKIKESHAEIKVDVNDAPHLTCETPIVSSNAISRHDSTVRIAGSGRSHFVVHSLQLTMKSGGIGFAKKQERTTPGGD